jgi:hypothetical protein
MTRSADQHLDRLADDAARWTLRDLGLDWSAVDQNVCAALRFRRIAPEAPPIVGLAGGASSGKSTLFNTLVGDEISRCSAHAHETSGAVAAVARREPRPAWVDAPLLLPGLARRFHRNCAPTAGEPGVLTIHEYDGAALAGRIVVDTPDVTSQMSAEEGWVTRALLPWFDGLLLVADEERWFDAAVFADTAELARSLGARLWVVFNRNEAGAPLSDEEQRMLAGQAAAHGAAAHAVSEYQAGSGYRPIAERTAAEIIGWVQALGAFDRQPLLEAHVHARSAAVLQDNLQRGEQFAALRQALHRRLGELCASTSLTQDLLTMEECRLLGQGQRYVPLYEMFQSLRRKLRRRPWPAAGDVQFEKNTADLAAVLQRNLEQRFGHAAQDLDRIIASSDYGRPLAGTWRAAWEPPRFDAVEWATRIRAHIDAWKAERQSQTRRGDAAAVAVGLPLLLADLLFLGGAGMTLAWTALTVAGFFGGKGLSSLLQRSPAFAAYQTTVRAYQSLVREALAEQCDRNLAAMPRRHLAMNDPLLESLMFWSLDVRR